jgi:hypothetical protein
MLVNPIAMQSVAVEQDTAGVRNMKLAGAIPLFQVDPPSVVYQTNPP